MGSNTTPDIGFCICGYCPTFKASPLSGRVFCAKGEAEEEAKKFGCLCNACPAFSKYGLKDEYFCVIGKSL